MSDTPPIERAQPRDFLAIAALDRVAWQASPDSEFIPDGEHVWRIWCEHAFTFIARGADGGVLGAVVAFPCVDGGYCLHKAMVAEAARGQGLGGRLFEALFAALDAKGAACFLTVFPGNANAIKLYRNWGFSQEVFAAGYYRENEDRLVLTRPARSTV